MDWISLKNVAKVYKVQYGLVMGIPLNKRSLAEALRLALEHDNEEQCCDNTSLWKIACGIEVIKEQMDHLRQCPDCQRRFENINKEIAEDKLTQT